MFKMVGAHVPPPAASADQRSGGLSIASPSCSGRSRARSARKLGSSHSVTARRPIDANGGEVAYILWEKRPLIAQATDTFVVRNGKILFQTFTAAT